MSVYEEAAKCPLISAKLRFVECNGPCAEPRWRAPGYPRLVPARRRTSDGCQVAPLLTDVVQDRLSPVLEGPVGTGPLRRGKREDVKRLTGQTAYPTIEFEDGTAYREESSDMAERIKAGRLFEGREQAGASGAPPPTP